MEITGDGAVSASRRGVVRREEGQQSLRCGLRIRLEDVVPYLIGNGRGLYDLFLPSPLLCEMESRPSADKEGQTSHLLSSHFAEAARSGVVLTYPCLAESVPTRCRHGLQPGQCRVQTCDNSRSHVLLRWKYTAPHHEVKLRKLEMLSRSIQVGGSRPHLLLHRRRFSACPVPHFAHLTERSSPRPPH